MNQQPAINSVVEVDAQLVRLLYSNSPTGLAVNVLVAFLLCWVLLPLVDHQILLIWLVAVLLATGLRFYNYIRFKRAQPSDAKIHPWRCSFMATTVVSGLVWGVTPWVFGPHDGLLTPMILAFTLGGLMAGAAAVLGGVLRVYIVYSVVIMGPIIVWFVLTPETLGIGLGIMLLVAVVALASNSIVYRRVLHDSINLSNAWFQAKQEAEDANLAKAQFLSRMSHELRTPLSAILGYAQIVQEHHARGSQHWTYLEQIVAATDHLLALINDLLELSHIESQNVTLKIQPVSCEAMIEQCLHDIKPLTYENHIHLYHIPGNEGLKVMADENRLRQIMLNLLTNACGYNEAGGRLGVGVDVVENDMVCLYVEDLSQTIPKEHHQQMFVSYHRLGDETEPVEGTGLGLMISQQLIALMRGRLDVSYPAGDGASGPITRFTVNLPRAVAESEPAAELTNDSVPEPVASSAPTVESTAGSMAGTTDGVLPDASSKP